MASKSGPLSWNLEKPMGTSESLPPLKIVSTPRLFAAVSDSSTIIASTKTCALRMSIFATRFLIISRVDSSAEIMSELVSR